MILTLSAYPLYADNTSQCTFQNNQCTTQTASGGLHVTCNPGASINVKCTSILGNTTGFGCQTNNMCLIMFYCNQGWSGISQVATNNSGTLTCGNK